MAGVVEHGDVGLEVADQLIAAHIPVPGLLEIAQAEQACLHHLAVGGIQVVVDQRDDEGGRDAVAGAVVMEPVAAVALRGPGCVDAHALTRAVVTRGRASRQATAVLVVVLMAGRALVAELTLILCVAGTGDGAGGVVAAAVAAVHAVAGAARLAVAVMVIVLEVLGALIAVGSLVAGVALARDLAGGIAAAAVVVAGQLGVSARRLALVIAVVVLVVPRAVVAVGAVVARLADALGAAVAIVAVLANSAGQAECVATGRAGAVAIVVLEAEVAVVAPGAGVALEAAALLAGASGILDAVAAAGRAIDQSGRVTSAGENHRQEDAQRAGGRACFHPHRPVG